MNYKWLGAALIVGACAMVGFSLAAGYRREEQALRQLIGALDYMSCELQYRRTPLPELCLQAGKERTGSVGRVLSELSMELEVQTQPDVSGCIQTAMSETDVPPKVRQAFIILGDSLGRFDLEGQLKGLESVRTYCRGQVQEMATGRDSRLRSYQTLGICAGAALAILFV